MLMQTKLPAAAETIFSKDSNNTVLWMKEWGKSELFEFIFIENVAWFNFLIGIFPRLNRILVVNHPNQLKEKKQKEHFYNHTIASLTN